MPRNEYIFLNLSLSLDEIEESKFTKNVDPSLKDVFFEVNIHLLSLFRKREEIQLENVFDS
jgi:hypothetical protein